MKEKINEPTPLRPEGSHILDAPVVPVDLPGFMAQIKQEESWKTSDRNAITVFKTDGLRIVLVALHEGASLAEHQAEGMLSVQVLSGKIEFKALGQPHILDQGQLVCLHETIPHSVLAREESVFLLTLAARKKG